jgi:hypothetical protein
VWIGCVCLELGFSQLLEREIDEECIVLSSNYTQWAAMAYTADRKKRLAVKMYDENVFLYRYPVEGGLVPLMYNVMWIRREGKVCYRVAVGQIHIDSWSRAGSVKEEICLG